MNNENLTIENVPAWPEDFSPRQRVIVHALIREAMRAMLTPGATYQMDKYRGIGPGFIKKLDQLGYIKPPSELLGHEQVITKAVLAALQDLDNTRGVASVEAAFVSVSEVVWPS